MLKPSLPFHCKDVSVEVSRLIMVLFQLLVGQHRQCGLRAGLILYPIFKGYIEK